MYAYVEKDSAGATVAVVLGVGRNALRALRDGLTVSLDLEKAGLATRGKLTIVRCDSQEDFVERVTKAKLGRDPSANGTG